MGYLQRALSKNVNDWTVLVVDDTPDNVTLLKFMLSRRVCLYSDAW